MRSPSRTQFALTALTVAASITLAACSQGSMHGSRTELYDSVAAMAGDSTNVVLVKVEAQKVTGRDETTRTDSTVSVQQVLTPEGLGTTTDESSKIQLTSGDEAQIRQLGSSKMSETPAPIHEVGKTYLLFLGELSLEGDALWVTGGDAGNFVPEGEAYVQVVDSDDSFPTKVAAGDLK